MHTLSKIFVGSFILFVGQVCFADSTLVADDDIKIIAINGQAVNQGLFQKTKQSFTVPAGQTTITARYDRIFILNRNDHDTIKSPDITLTATLDDTQTYRLTMPNLPSTHRQAQEFVKNATLELHLGNQVLMSEQTVNNRPSLLSGLFGKKEVAIPPTKPASPKTPTTDPVAQFKTLWERATPEQKQQIQDLMNHP